MHCNDKIGTNILIESLLSDLHMLSPKEQPNNDPCGTFEPETNSNSSPHMWPSYCLPDSPRHCISGL